MMLIRQLHFRAFFWKSDGRDRVYRRTGERNVAGNPMKIVGFGGGFGEFFWKLNHYMLY